MILKKMSDESISSQQNDTLQALKRVFTSISLTRGIQRSTRLFSYFLAAVTIYVVADGDIATVNVLSPVLGRLIDQIGGDLLVNFLERVSKGKNDALSLEQIRELIEDKLSGLSLDDALTEKEFYRTISRLRRQDEEKFQTLSQGIATTLSLLREVSPSDPAPLSIIPRSARPLLTLSPLVGREADLAWLRNTTGDRLLIGQPGIGKTFLFYQLAVDGYGLFALNRNRGDLAAALREEKPLAVMVDNAHVEQEMLLNLRQIREEFNLEFDILASSWPGAKDLISEILHLNEINIHELARLNADQIVEIVKFTGIAGPKSVIREIREQADGRPGLAVTLTEMYKQGGGRDVWQGNVLKRSILSFEPLSQQSANVIIAAFSLGGEAGMPHRLIAKELDISLLDLQQQVSYLAAAGIIWEVDKNHLSVKPSALRHAVVRDIFFTGTAEWWDIRRFLQHAPYREETAITLVGAQARGANIPQDLLIEQLEEANSIAAWMSYAALGISQKDWVLQNHPEKIIHFSLTSLQLVPEEVIPLMLSAAVGDQRLLGPNPSHPMRLIQDWVQAAPPDTTSVVERRKLLLDKTQIWMDENGDPAVCLRALQLVMSPKFEAGETDPGLGNTYIISFGLITIEEILAVQDLWTTVYSILNRIDIGYGWEPIRDMIHEWAYPEIAMLGDKPLQEVVQLLHSFAAKMLRDILTLVEKRLGILHWAAGVANHLDKDINVPVDRDFMLLYPIIESFEDWEKPLNQNLQTILEVADTWVGQSPERVAERLNQIEVEARIADIRWPRLTPFLCKALADRVDDVFSWVQAFRSVDLDADLVEPFQKKWLEKDKRDGG